MAFSLEERPNSRQMTNNPPSIVVQLVCTGEFDEWQLMCRVDAATPLVYYHPNGATLYRQDYQMDPQGFDVWHVTVPYGPRQREEGTASFTFDTGGATVTVKHGRAHVADYSTTTSNVNEFGGLINATPDGVEGTEIVIPALRLTWTFSHPRGDITVARVKALAAATGTTNSGSFRGFAAGELLFVGASGNEGTDCPAGIAYNCIAMAHLTGASIGPISGIDKNAHDYLWVSYDAVTVGGVAGKVIRRVNVERMYNASDFASVFGWS